MAVECEQLHVPDLFWPTKPFIPTGWVNNFQVCLGGIKHYMSVGTLDDVLSTSGESRSILCRPPQLMVCRPIKHSSCLRNNTCKLEDHPPPPLPQSVSYADLCPLFFNFSGKSNRNRSRWRSGLIPFWQQQRFFNLNKEYENRNNKVMCWTDWCIRYIGFTVCRETLVLAFIGP